MGAVLYLLNGRSGNVPDIACYLAWIARLRLVPRLSLVPRNGLGVTPLVDIIALESFDHFKILPQQFGEVDFVSIDPVVIEL